MSQREKNLAKLKNNPKNVSFEDLCTVLQQYGFVINSAGKGSHCSVEHSVYDLFDIMEPNSIPRKKPHLLPVYVKKAIHWIERVKTIEKNG